MSAFRCSLLVPGSHVTTTGGQQPEEDDGYHARSTGATYIGLGARQPRGRAATAERGEGA